MQNNKTKVSAAVKRLIALSLVTAVGLGNVPLQTRAQSSEENSPHSESYSSDEDDSSCNSENSSLEQYPETQQTTTGTNDDSYIRTSWTEQEKQQLLAIARGERRFNQDRNWLQAAISTLAWAFRPCFRGVLGSHKKD